MNCGRIMEAYTQLYCSTIKKGYVSTACLHAIEKGLVSATQIQHCGSACCKAASWSAKAVAAHAATMLLHYYNDLIAEAQPQCFSVVGDCNISSVKRSQGLTTSPNTIMGHINNFSHFQKADPNGLFKLVSPNSGEYPE